MDDSMLTVDVLGDNAYQNMKAVNCRLGLAFDEWDIKHYVRGLLPLT